MQLIFASITVMSLLQFPVATAATQGTVPLTVPGLSDPAETWYEVHGDLNSDKTPLVILHGGPGACHDYLKPLTDLDVPLVFYDQLGCGKSTHLEEKNGDENFWTVDLFKSELDNLLRHLGLDERPIDLYGHSWGGMLAAEWAASKSCKSTSLRRLIISNSLASMDSWLEGVDALVAELPADARKAIADADESGDYTSPEFAAAMDVFYQRHFSLSRPWPPPEVEAAFNCLGGDPTVYGTMYGPSETSVTGSLRNWTVIPKLHKIEAPTLLINGAQDEAQDVAMQPFFDKMKKVKWITLDNAAHLSHVDLREKYMKLVQDFLDY